MLVFFEVLGAAVLLTAIITALLWGLYLIQKNGSVADLAWPITLFLITLSSVFIGEGDFVKKLVVLILVSAWALRLFSHLWQRFDVYTEDPRYSFFLASIGGEGDSKTVLVLYSMQAIATLILALPIYIVSVWGTSQWSVWEVAGIFFFVLALWGEYAADKELAEFKKDPSNKDKVCREGLWRFSRHPNYFFEWMIWVALFLYAFANPAGWFAILSPALMFYLLTHVTGIPLNEAQALTTKGDEYRRYQQTTSSFFPWLPKAQKSKSVDK